jgi:protein-disulfide isomerase
MRLVTIPRLAALAAALLALPAAHAQATVGQPPFTPFRDTALLKPPAGHPVAILEFEDLECPACAHAAPIVKTAVEKYKVPFVRHDFLIQGHAWSRDAAITARYLEDKVSPELAEQFRRDVFANQISIFTLEDLQNFERGWFPKHGQQMPFVADPSGRFAAEVQADCTLGERLGLIHTPTIVVLTTKGWTEVTDVSQLYSVLDRAIANTPAQTTAKNTLRKPASTTATH